MTGRFSASQYSITWRIRRAVAMGLPSSLTATMPASFIAAISASASPLLPTDAAPMGHTRTLAVAEARSFTGCVLGMQQTAVKPPRAADFVPVSMVSESSPPGSRKWQCRSMNPGATKSPEASRISAPCSERFAPTLEIRPPSSNTSSAASVLLAGSRTRPFLIRSIRAILCGMGRVQRRAANKMIEKRHAHGEAVGDLFEDGRLRAVRDRRIDFEAANHGPWMEHQRIRASHAQTFARKLVAQDVFLGREGGFVQAFGLHAQNHDDIRIAQSFLDAGGAADIRRNGFKFARHPHGRAAQRDARAEFGKQMDIGARHAAVNDVPQNRDVPAIQFALAVTDGKSIQQRLRGMFVHAVARVEHGDIHALGDERGRARGAVADDEAVGTHGFKRANGVRQRFALLQTGGLGLQVHAVRTEARGSGGEADTRARGGLEKCKGDGFTTKSGQFF